MPRKSTDAVMPNPALIGVNHDELRMISLPTHSDNERMAREPSNDPYRVTTANEAAVMASCEAICVQSRKPRTKAPVGSLYGTMT